VPRSHTIRPDAIQKGRGKAIKRIWGDETEGSQPIEATPLPDPPAAEIEKDDADSAAQSVVAVSVASDVDDELEASSQSKSKKARVLPNLTENEQEEVALFLHFKTDVQARLNAFLYLSHELSRIVPNSLLFALNSCRRSANS